MSASGWRLQALRVAGRGGQRRGVNRAQPLAMLQQCLKAPGGTSMRPSAHRRTRPALQQPRAGTHGRPARPRPGRRARLQLAAVVLQQAAVREEELLAHDGRPQQRRAARKLALHERRAPRRLRRQRRVRPAAPHGGRRRARLRRAPAGCSGSCARKAHASSQSAHSGAAAGGAAACRTRGTCRLRSVTDPTPTACTPRAHGHAAAAPRACGMTNMNARTSGASSAARRSLPRTRSASAAVCRK
jgi:hypothetical protein